MECNKFLRRHSQRFCIIASLCLHVSAMFCLVGWLTCTQEQLLLPPWNHPGDDFTPGSTKKLWPAAWGGLSSLGLGFCLNYEALYFLQLLLGFGYFIALQSTFLNHTFSSFFLSLFPFFFPPQSKEFYSFVGKRAKKNVGLCQISRQSNGFETTYGFIWVSHFAYFILIYIYK